MNKIAIVFLFTITSTFFVGQAKAQALVSCPDMNGHFRYKQIGATADAFITQTGCDNMRILIQADVLGKKYVEDIQSPLDGVTRPATPPGPNETDTISAKWNGDTVTFIVDRYITDPNTGNVKHTTTKAEAFLKSANKLHASGATLDANGNPVNPRAFDLDRIP